MSPPPAEDYLRLRREAGLRPKTADQARGVLAGSWAFCHAVHAGTGEIVGMGRLLGDGGWYSMLLTWPSCPPISAAGWVTRS